MGRNPPGVKRTIKLKLTGDGGGQTYPESVYDEILARLSRGDSLLAICRDEGFPNTTAVHYKINHNKEYGERYAAARKVGYAIWADEVKEISDKQVKGVKTVHKETKDGDFTETTTYDAIEHRKLQVDSRKWLLARLDAGSYGDRMKTEMTGADGTPLSIQIVQFSGDSKNPK